MSRVYIAFRARYRSGRVPPLVERETTGTELITVLYGEEYRVYEVEKNSRLEFKRWYAQADGGGKLVRCAFTPNQYVYEAEGL